MKSRLPDCLSVGESNKIPFSSSGYCEELNVATTRYTNITGKHVHLYIYIHIVVTVIKTKTQIARRDLIAFMPIVITMRAPQVKQRRGRLSLTITDRIKNYHNFCAVISSLKLRWRLFQRI